MANFPEFNAVDPVVVPSVAEKVYGKYQLVEFNVRANNPNQPIRVRAGFKAYREVEVTKVVDGQTVTTTEKEFDPKGKTVEIVVKDMVEASEQDPEFAQAMGAVMAVTKKIGIAQGLFKNE